jgi:hypothetical protein
MRRQNPPQATLDQAQALEGWLKPAPLGVAYVVCATAGFVVITLLFAILSSGNILRLRVSTSTFLALLAVGPCALALVEFWRKPDDLLSAVIRGLADSRRRPLNVTAEHCAFKVLLMNGEPLCADLAFHYPAKYHTPQVREYIVCHVRLALEREASLRNDPPSTREVLDSVDGALDRVASEFNIPVLYSQVLDLHKIRDAYSKPEDLPTLPQYRELATGTLG